MKNGSPAGPPFTNNTTNFHQRGSYARPMSSEHILTIPQHIERRKGRMCDRFAGWNNYRNLAHVDAAFAAVPKFVIHYDLVSTACAIADADPATSDKLTDFAVPPFPECWIELGFALSDGSTWACWVKDNKPEFYVERPDYEPPLNIQMMGQYENSRKQEAVAWCFGVCLGLLAVRNAGQTVSVDMTEANAFRAKLGRPALFSYKVCTVRHRFKQLHLGRGGSRDLPHHMVRGHFKERKSGKFFWHPHVRGDVKNGSIRKDYIVQ